VASAWHQIGNVHTEAGEFESAEEAYRKSLAITVRESDLFGQASSLGQLGILYNSMGRMGEAVTFYRQAADVFLRLKNLAQEGVARSNLANALIKLRRYDETRQELQRAIECKKSSGHTTEPWKTWSLLENLERATGHTEEARAARQQAIDTYLAYRRAGGVSQSDGDQLLALVAQGIQQNAEDEARQILDQVATKSDTPPVGKTLIARLQSILAGDRNPALAHDPELHYGDAAELQLLLEALDQDSPEGENHLVP
jgi:tetratricopeptide (TPR) repeat protein